MGKIFSGTLQIKNSTTNKFVIFNGVSYRVFPTSKDRNAKRYFRSERDKSGRRKRKYLHRAVWESIYGPVPPGHHIHHRDGNTFNNSIDNLEMIDEKKHGSLHGKQGSGFGHISGKIIKDRFDKLLPSAFICFFCESVFFHRRTIKQVIRCVGCKGKHVRTHIKNR